MPTLIQTPTPDLNKSVDFYTQLNFKILSASTPTLLSDGNTVIEINPDRFARAGLKMINPSWESIVKQLKNLTKVIKIDNGYFCADPSGCAIYLMESEEEVPFSLDQLKEGKSALGNFAGLSLETPNIELSIKIWETLGFSKSMGGLEQGWITFKNEDDFSVSLMQPYSCPHLFFNPSMTFFNGKENLKIIENLRKLGIPMTEEITAFNNKGIVDNVIIRDPGGYGFFIFSD